MRLPCARSQIPAPSPPSRWERAPPSPADFVARRLRSPDRLIPGTMSVDRRATLTKPLTSTPSIQKSFDLRMPSRREDIAPTVETILDLASGADLDRERRQDLAVALAEALANAAVHGNRLQKETFVEVRVEIEPGDAVSVSVTDSGSGFDTTKVADPTDVPNLLVPRGRGVFLMKRLVDRVEFNAMGNSVRLTIRSQRPH